MKEERNALEWFSLALGTLVTLLTLAYLAYLTTTEDPSPPRLSVRIGAPVAAEGTYEVPITVQNLGGQTAEEVEVEASLGEERSHFSVEFIPEQDSAIGWVCFSRPPGQELRVGEPVSRAHPAEC